MLMQKLEQLVIVAHKCWLNFAGGSIYIVSLPIVKRFNKLRAKQLHEIRVPTSVKIYTLFEHWSDRQANCSKTSIICLQVLLIKHSHISLIEKTAQDRPKCTGRGRRGGVVGPLQLPGLLLYLMDTATREGNQRHTR